MRIPDKWRDYVPCGVPIRNERIIAFKTPLSRQFDSKSDQDNGLMVHERFTPMDLVQEIQLNQRETLGMVIDLTNTFRYYNGLDLEQLGVHYEKVKCVGQEIPSEEVVERFKAFALDFFEKDHSGSLLGVHCTHGLNRAGYIVCRFLIECRGFDPEDAIEAFNDARGHVMERQNYLDDLRQRRPHTVRRGTSNFLHRSYEGNVPHSSQRRSSFSERTADREDSMRSGRERRRVSEHTTHYGERYRPYTHGRDASSGLRSDRCRFECFESESSNRETRSRGDLRNRLSTRRDDYYGNSRHGDYAHQSSDGYYPRGREGYESYDAYPRDDGRYGRHAREVPDYRASSARDGFHGNPDRHASYAERRYGNNPVERAVRPRRPARSDRRGLYSRR